MSANQLAPNADRSPSLTAGWRELWLKEDWWAVWLGLGIVVIGYILFANGAPQMDRRDAGEMVEPRPTRSPLCRELATLFRAVCPSWLVLFSVALTALGMGHANFIPSFVFLYAFSVLIFVLGQSTQANYYNWSRRSWRCCWDC